MSNEFIPVISGIVLGFVLRFLPSRRLPVGLAASLVVGCLATFTSGEYHEGIIYFLIDTLQVAFCATMALVVATRKGQRRSSSRVN
jgi:hypothetical protein